MERQGGTNLIVVADDEQLVADSTAEILRTRGFEAVSAHSGREAMELVLRLKPDILLVDVVMPDIDGVQIAIELCRTAPNCRIILFSGQTDTVDLLEQARRDGHEFEILAKPVHPEELLKTVSKPRPSSHS